MTDEKKVKKYCFKPGRSICGEKFKELYTQYRIAFDELNIGHYGKIEHLLETTCETVSPILSDFFDQNTTVFAVKWCLQYRTDTGEIKMTDVPEHWFHYFSERGNGNVVAHYYFSYFSTRQLSCSVFTMQHIAAWRWIMQQKPCYLTVDTQKYIQSMDQVIDDAFSPYMSRDCQRLVEQYLNYVQ